MARRNGWLAPGSRGRALVTAIPGALYLLVLLVVAVIVRVPGVFSGMSKQEEASLTPGATLLGWTLILAFVAGVIWIVIWALHG